MIIYINAFFLSLLITWFFIPQILAISLKGKFIDIPCERSIHSCLAIRSAGIAFLPSIAIAILICTLLIDDLHQQPQYNYQFFLQYSIPCLIMYLLGIVDDIRGIRYRTKFLYQLLAAIILVFSGCWFHSLYGFVEIYSLSFWQSFLFSILVIILIINSINLIDGIDGLAAGLGIVATLIYGVCFCLKQEIAPAILSFATAGTLFSFIRYNLFSHSAMQVKIFMGDTGALFLGTILSILSLQLSANNNSGYDGSFFFLVAYSVLIVPCFDVIRVFMYRIKNGKPPFMPDTNHIHHKLMKLFISQRITLWIIIGLDIFFCAINLILYNIVSISTIIAIDITIWTALNIIISCKIKNKIGK